MQEIYISRIWYTKLTLDLKGLDITELLRRISLICSVSYCPRHRGIDLGEVEFFLWDSKILLNVLLNNNYTTTNIYYNHVNRE